MKAYIIDANGIMAGIDFSISGLQFTTKEVARELKDGNSRRILDWMISSGKLMVEDANITYVDKVMRVAMDTGDYSKLSEADISILALALELRDKGYEPIIVSDDYSIQNLSSYFSIRFIPVQKKPVKWRITWVYRCKECGLILDEWRETCPVCGGKLGRIARRRKLVRGQGFEPWKASASGS